MWIEQTNQATYINLEVCSLPAIHGVGTSLFVHVIHKLDNNQPLRKGSSIKDVGNFFQFLAHPLPMLVSFYFYLSEDLDES